MKELTQDVGEGTLGGPGGDSADQAEGMPMTPLRELLFRMEEAGFHHAGGRKDHYRSGVTVDLLYQLVLILLKGETDD